MTTQHPLETQLPLAPLRPFRCHRHRPWMASCDDCRKAHSPQAPKAATTA